MYQRYFGLATAPFSIAPDPRYLYMSQRHQEALATLLYGLGSDGGFVLLTGEVGAGKTTICRRLLEQLPDACDVAYIFNPKLTVTELLSTICDEFGIAYPEGTRSIKRFVDLINKYLLESHAKGRRAVLIIDEAQNLSVEVLEQIRLLTNLETNQRKLLQILLLGQPELVTMLARPELRQLAQRIVARYHLMPLNKTEVAAYVKHRLEVAGAPGPLFPEGLGWQLYKLSGGVPRVINVLCDRALLGAFVQRKPLVDRATLAQAACEVLPPGQQHQPRVRRSILAGATLGLGGTLVIYLYSQQLISDQLAAAQNTAAGPTRLAAKPARAAPAQLVQTTQVGLENEATPDTLTLPPDVPTDQSQILAFATLFNKWHVVYRDREDPCTQAAAHGLQCRTGRGGLDELRQLNIPVILHMVDGQGHTFYATLTGLRTNSATFSFGAQSRDVSLAALALQWSGDYTMLLRIPREMNEQVERSERGAAAWMAKQLARLQDTSGSTSAHGVVDDALTSRIKQFQISHGLTAEGVVGLKTPAHFGVAAEPSKPTLAATERRE